MQTSWRWHQRDRWDFSFLSDGKHRAIISILSKKLLIWSFKTPFLPSACISIPSDTLLLLGNPVVPGVSWWPNRHHHGQHYQYCEQKLWLLHVGALSVWHRRLHCLPGWDHRLWYLVIISLERWMSVCKTLGDVIFDTKITSSGSRHLCGEPHQSLFGACG